ncbi:MAG: DNA recombination protein RmuC [candidate division WOR-3 bacterium]
MLDIILTLLMLVVCFMFFYMFIHLKKEHKQKSANLEEKIKELAQKIDNIDLNAVVKDIKQELNSFQAIFSKPSNKGLFGELAIGEILKQLPQEMVKAQYPIGPNKVDYAIILDNLIIPVDSKFIAFKDEADLIDRVKTLIKAVGTKYVNPQYKTRFAIIYVANEGVYQAILSSKLYDNVFELARKYKVYILSPSTFEIVVSVIIDFANKIEIIKTFDSKINEIKSLQMQINQLYDKFNKGYQSLGDVNRLLLDIISAINRIVS